MDDGFYDVAKRSRVCVLVRCRGSIYHSCLLYQTIYICVFSCELRELLLIVLAGYLSELEAIPTKSYTAIVCSSSSDSNSRSVC